MMKSRFYWQAVCSRSLSMTWWCVALVSAWCLAGALACDLSPAGPEQVLEGGEGPPPFAPKLPGDNFYRIVLSRDVERYAPGQRYVVTLVGSRTHDVVQQFTRFKLQLWPQDPTERRSLRRQGQFQLFADTLSRFDQLCVNSVVEADDLPKTEVQVMWKAPPAGSGCVLIKAMVYENASRWFAEDGQLTRRVCEDTTLSKPDCCACDDAQYKLTFEGLWSPATHPKDFPVAAMWLTHFSDLVGATHGTNFSFWGERQIATDGFRSLAEWGSTGPLESELRQRQREGAPIRGVVKAQGLWHPRLNDNTSAAFTVDRRRHQLSLASMFGPTPDWVVGVNGLELCLKNCSWVEDTVVDLYPYDAGTDNGISYMSPNDPTVPRERIYRITEMYPEDPRAPFYNPGGKMAPLARLYLRRDKLIPRACDEEVLQAQVIEVSENTDAVQRPECGVSEWSPWSPCSVTCGKGLRMRTREYRMPQKAQMFSCDRQLVSKEMCVADLPECPDSGAEPLDTLPSGAGAEAGAGICAVSEWGAWEECSTSCGVGVSTRRRHFLDRMGIKKCPLVSIEEKRKCMGPPCPSSPSGEAADPSCPTTEWSAWSPCSSSCGRGVRFRTRLLLVHADKQMECAARTELMQQQPCLESDVCTLDMQTAKRVCMEEPEVGPCRGVYQRWAFAPAKGMCVPFLYGGCRGNRNNFLTAEECLNTCSVVLGGQRGGGGAGAGLAGAGQSPLPAVRSNYPGLTVNSIVSVAPSANASSPSPLDCVVSEWSEWTPCSATCGVGTQVRTRTVVSPAGPGGAPCPPRMTRRRRCFVRC